MATQQGVWGIDIGQCALKALRLEMIDGVVTATAFDYIEHPKILSQPDADPDQLTREALETFLSRNTIKGDLVAMSIAGQSGLARFVKLPPVEEKKIADIVRFEAKQQIPFPLDEVVWDYQKINTGTVTDGFAMDTEIGLFAMKRDMISRFLHHFQAVKVEVHIVQMAPLALCNYVTYDLLKRSADGQPRKEVAADDTPAGKRRCVVALDIGTDGSSLIITDGERIIWQRPIPIGGNHFTRALTKELKLTFAKAEHLKRNAAKSPDLAKILKALRPVLTDFVNEVQRSLGYFTNTHRDAHVAYMVGLGSAFRLPGLQKFLSEKLQLDVRKPNSLDELSGESVVTAPVFTENLLSFPVSYGLALQGLKCSRLITNLLPQEIQFDRMIRAKKPWSVAAAAAILLGVGVVSFGFGMRSQSLGNPLTPEKTPSDSISKAVGEVKGAVDAAGRKKKEAGDKQTEIGKTTLDVKSIIAGKDERPNWVLLNEFVSYCLPQPDGKNLVNFDKNEPPVKQREFWTDAANSANRQFQERRLGSGNVVDLPLDDEALRNLINIDIDAIFPMYADDLKVFYENAKAVTLSAKYQDVLPGIDLFSPPAPTGGQAPKKYDVEFPTGPGWIVEVRAHTYFNPRNNNKEFLLKTLVFNLNAFGYGSGLAPYTATAAAAAGPGAASPGPGTTGPQKPLVFPHAINGRVSHAFLFWVLPVPDAEPGQLVHIDSTSLPELLGSTGGGTGGAIGTAGFTPMGGPMTSGPMTSGPMSGGSAAPAAAAISAARSGWQPIGRAIGGSGGKGFGARGGVAGEGVAGATPGLPATAGTAGKNSQKRTRYEFVVIFTWREPVGNDSKDAKAP